MVTENVRRDGLVVSLEELLTVSNDMPAEVL